MRYTFEIQDTQTNETRQHQDAYDWNDESHMLFMFRDGNYSCDCNRELFFQRAAGEAETDLDAVVCGEGRYVIARAQREDGSFIEIDAKPQPTIRASPGPR